MPDKSQKESLIDAAADEASVEPQFSDSGLLRIRARSFAENLEKYGRRFSLWSERRLRPCFVAFCILSFLVMALSLTLVFLPDWTRVLVDRNALEDYVRTNSTSEDTEWLSDMNTQHKFFSRVYNSHHYCLIPHHSSANLSHPFNFTRLHTFGFLPDGNLLAWRCYSIDLQPDLANTTTNSSAMALFYRLKKAEFACTVTTPIWMLLAIGAFITAQCVNAINCRVYLRASTVFNTLALLNHFAVMVLYKISWEDFSLGAAESWPHPLYEFTWILQGSGVIIAFILLSLLLICTILSSIFHCLLFKLLEQKFHLLDRIVPDKFPETQKINA